MNRLILIGNGFDLAHGLKTSYKSFITWYLESVFVTAAKTENYEDSLIKVSRDDNYKGAVLYSDENIRAWVSPLRNFATPIQQRVTLTGRSNTSNLTQPFYVELKSTLLESLLVNCGEAGWVDIEAEFYEKLKAILKLNPKHKNQALLSLNESLRTFVELLERYLITLPSPPYLDEYANMLRSPILGVDVLGLNGDNDSYANQTCIVNFNYTDTLEEYVKRMKESVVVPNVIHIHGQLNNSSNPIIFGFGDELDKVYKEMEEDSRVVGYFEFIKSFWYLRTNNYRELVNFIDSDEYQVIILGHSCGLSDRTMLQMIFEHQLCRSVKIYYHGSSDRNNFIPITHEIARHFTNKGEMRKKIVSMERSLPMPQV